MKKYLIILVIFVLVFTVSAQDVSRSSAPNSNYANHGMNSSGEYYEDSTIILNKYVLPAGATITTHSHGIVIVANKGIWINGTINVKGLGGYSGDGFSIDRMSILDIINNYGKRSENQIEPLVYGQGCSDNTGGGYVILHAPIVYISGNIDARGNCGNGGIVYLEGNNIDISGNIRSYKTIQRGI